MSTPVRQSSFAASAKQPATPKVVPPTPINGKATLTQTTSRTTAFVNPSQNDMDDLEIQTKRRSLFRSPGTASSPDLATLVRKANAKAKAKAEAQAREEGESSNSHLEPPGSSSSAGFLSPSAGANSTNRSGRARSSTASNAKSPNRNHTGDSSSRDPNRSAKGKERATSSSYTDSDSPIKSKERSNGKSGGSSMRQKTSAFFGRMVGQNSVRDKYVRRYDPNAIPNSSKAPPLPESFRPPVPQLPEQYRLTTHDSSSGSDVFHSLPASPDFGKPLPPISNHGHDEGLDDDEDKTTEQGSVSTAHPPALPNPIRPRSPSPQRTVRQRQGDMHRRRRSMSLGDVDLPPVALPMDADALALSQRPSEDTEGRDSWDNKMTGFMSEFKGQISSKFDDIQSTPLLLEDPFLPSSDTRSAATTPSTPVSPPERRSSLPDLPETEQTSSRHMLSPRPQAYPSPSSYTRSPSRYPSSPVPSSRLNNLRAGHRGLPQRPSSANIFSHAPASTHSMGSPDNKRLVPHPRSAASASEPSLVPPGKEESRSLESGDKTVRLVPSTSFAGLPSGTTETQHDTGGRELGTTRLSNNISDPGISDDDLEERARDFATKCWTQDESFLPREKMAQWLGGVDRINRLALRHYMNYFDLSNLALDQAFRRLCAKLYVKAESQQLDRLLDEFARRYWDCNPRSLFGNAGVVHAVMYSLLLLNTDLHVAELTSHMSRTQFVRNTLSTIQAQVKPDPSEYQSSTSEVALNSNESSSDLALEGEENSSSAEPRPKRSGSLSSWHSVAKPSPPVIEMTGPQGSSPRTSTDTAHPTPRPNTEDVFSSKRSTSSAAQSFVFDKAWENEMEALLKEMFNSIRSQQILQPVVNTGLERSNSSLSPGAPHTSLLRNGSRRGQSSDRLATLKRGSIRGLQTLMGPHASPYSSNSSIDGRISPSPSFATSMGDGLSASSSSFFTTPTLGFASNLSHTIIRETQEDDSHSVASDDSISTSISVTDAELALLGPPFAKEGSLSRKHFWESEGKRGKDKSWMEVFVVIQKGELDMFTFGTGGGSLGGQVVGGGNWLSNASNVGRLSLAHSLAHSLPPPGYSRQRPHCLVLTLASGAVYFFQAGTEDLVNEWVSTCNYWAARQSKEPLPGGVSNIDYGWNRVIDAASDDRNTGDQFDAMSIRSGRSMFSKRSIPEGLSRLASSPHSDRSSISEWRPPPHSTVPSQYDEETQLEALQKQVKTLNEELEAHHALQIPMLGLYHIRSQNHAKAKQNWEKKTQFLTGEIVKYETYVDSLKAAMAIRLKKRGEKVLEKALVNNNVEDGAFDRGHQTRWPEFSEDAIPEADEPSTPAGPETAFPHRRDTLDDGSTEE
ncbi:hypothetical protein SISNIDRAFT_404603 [Sistotremastrum niveocremeum HHB9708]|uniref:SEC7 domain-containing protein n=1 Tax=Sistotremastrum niveocremeum HHB9708 TaxID=1314777 RepID=A0A165A2U8_9AGAM|nr:hypothetical protein SISNIDRAFT_404603 [Sistotremastrum niveocremeum HHB9708]